MNSKNEFLVPRLQTSFLKIDNILHPLYEGLNTVGRTKNATVAVRNENVSHHHAIITIIKDRHYISDIGSINGTFLNKSKLQSLLLYELSQDSTIDFACVPAVYIKSPSFTQLSSNNSAVGRNTQDLNDSVFLAETQSITSTNTQNLNCFDDDYNFAEVPIEDNVEMQNRSISIHDLPTQLIDTDIKEIENHCDNPEFDIHELPTQIFDSVTACSSNQLVVIDVNTSEGIADSTNGKNSSSQNKLLEDSQKQLVENNFSETNNADIHTLPTQINSVRKRNSSEIIKNDHALYAKIDTVGNCSKDHVVVDINLSKGDNEDIHSATTQVKTTCNNLLKENDLCKVSKEGCNERLQTESISSTSKVADVLPQVRLENERADLSNLNKVSLNMCDENDDSYLSVRRTQFNASDIVDDSLLNDSGFDIKENDNEASNKEIVSSTNFTQESDVHHIRRKCLPLSLTQSLSENDNECSKNIANISQELFIVARPKKKNSMIINSDSDTDDDLELNQVETKVSVHEDTKQLKQNINSSDVETDIEDFDIAKDNIFSKPKEDSDSDTDIEDILQATSVHEEGRKNLNLAKSDSDTDMEEDFAAHTENKSYNKTDLVNEQICETDIVPETQMSDNDGNDFEFGVKENSTAIEKNSEDEFTQESFSLRLTSYMELSEEIEMIPVENNNKFSGDICNKSLEEGKNDYPNKEYNVQPSTSKLNSDLYIQPQNPVNQNPSNKPIGLSKPKQSQEIQKALINVSEVLSNTVKKVHTKSLFLPITNKSDSSDKCANDEIFNQQTQEISEENAAIKLISNLNDSDVFSQATQKICSEDPNLGNQVILPVTNFNESDLFDQATQKLSAEGKHVNIFEEPTQIIEEVEKTFNETPKLCKELCTNDDIFVQPTQKFIEPTENISKLDYPEPIPNTSSNKEHVFVLPKQKPLTDQYESEDIFNQSTQKIEESVSHCANDDIFIQSTQKIEEPIKIISKKDIRLQNNLDQNDLYDEPTQQLCTEIRRDDIYDQPTQQITELQEGRESEVDSFREKEEENELFLQPTQKVLTNDYGNVLINNLKKDVIPTGHLGTSVESKLEAMFSSQHRLQEKRESEVDSFREKEEENGLFLQPTQKVLSNDCGNVLKNNSKNDVIPTGHAGTSVESQLEVMFSSQPLQYIPISQSRPLNPLSIILEENDLNSSENENEITDINSDMMSNSSSNSIIKKSKNRTVDKKNKQSKSSIDKNEKAENFTNNSESTKGKGSTDENIQNEEQDVETISRLKKRGINRVENVKSKSSDTVSSAMSIRRNKKQVTMCIENKTSATNIGISETEEVVPKNVKSRVTTRRNKEQSVSLTETIKRANTSRNTDREQNSAIVTKSRKLKKGVDSDSGNKSLIEEQNDDSNEETDQEKIEINPTNELASDQSKDISVDLPSTSTRSSVRNKRTVGKGILMNVKQISTSSIENDNSNDSDEFLNKRSTRNKKFKCNATERSTTSTKSKEKVVEEQLVIEITDDSNEDDQEKPSTSRSNKRKEINLNPSTTPTKKKKVETSTHNSKDIDSVTTRRGNKLQADCVDVTKKLQKSKPTEIRREKQIIIEITDDSNEEEPQKGSPPLTRTSKRKEVNLTDSDTSTKKKKFAASNSKKGAKLQSSSKKQGKTETISESEMECSSSSSNSKILATPTRNEQLNNSSLDTPTRNRRKLKPKVVFTMLDSPELESLIRSLGGMIVDSVSACTVLVTPSLKRSQKLLSAVGQGKPICSPKWLHECKKANTFLDPWDFILEDKAAEAHWNLSLKESLKRSQNTKILANYSIHLMVNNATDVLKAAIESCGGKYVSKVTSRISHNLLIVSTIENRTKYAKFLKQTPPVMVITPEAIFDGVLRQELHFEDHILS